MSTRRARIKAVTSLPPRRKNNDAADKNKAKILEKDSIEKPTRSPRTPRGSLRTQDSFDRRSPKSASPLKSPRSINNVFKYQAERIPSPLAEVTKEVPLTPKRSEKVSVITSVFSVKPNNVFVSPRNVGSPLRRHAVSPLVHGSKVEVSVQRLTPITPEKPKQKSVERRSSFEKPSNERRPSIERRPSTERRPSFERPSIERRPSFERPNIEGRPSIERRPSTERRPSFERPNIERRPSIEHRPSTERRPSFERPTIERRSSFERPNIERRPSVERRPSTERRPSFERPNIARRPSFEQILIVESRLSLESRLGAERRPSIDRRPIERRPSVDAEITNGKSKEARKDSVSTQVSSDVPDDYNVPSVPESITEDTVMDGIVPLQTASSAPKPLALLKNEIISENAEVLFDPIVPLPSPSKVRPKLRPVPRLAPLRRNSVQGSASESEDESRRALLRDGGPNTPAPQRQRHDSHTSHSTMHSLPNREMNRIRNDSVCSTVSQATTQPPTASSPVKDKHLSKSRRLDMSRRMAAMRRRRETVKKDTLTMYDLIFYNPTTNPIIPDKDEIKAQEANEKEEAARKAKQDEDNVDDPDEAEADEAPVPQIKLGPNGEIMLDEQSLVIKQSDKRKVSDSVIHEGAWGTSNTSGRYRRTPRTADWSDAETVRFYRALAALGTDFMLMENLFPGRTRRDLKLKFKKEERVNMAQVDKALRTTCKWDAARLIEEFQEEREEADKAARKEALELQRRASEHKQRQKEARELKMRLSRGSKALGGSCFPVASSGTLSADEVIQRHHEIKASVEKGPPKKRGRPVKPAAPATSQLATITTTRIAAKSPKPTSIPNDMATIRKIDPSKPQGKTPDKQAPTTPVVPPNIENGSLVVLTVNDPNSPSKKMLQTYIASGGGRLTPVALPTSFLNSVVTYMKKGGTPKSNAGSSPHLPSPNSVASQDSRSCSTPGVLQMRNSPKRKRHSSYTITQI